MASPGHLTVTLPQGITLTGQGLGSDLTGSDGFTFPLVCDDIQYETQQPYRNAVLDVGEVDYQSINPAQGVAWNLLEDLSHGIGGGGISGFFAGRGRYNKGTYSMCDNFDAEYKTQGPLQVNEYPGIPFGVSPVGHYWAGTTEIVWTDSAAHALFRRTAGAISWTQIGGTALTAANATTNSWNGTRTAAVQCVAHLGTRLMVGFAAGEKWIYSDTITGTVTWTTEPEVTIANAEYAHVATNATFETSSGVYEECIIFLGDNGKLYKTTNLTADSAAGGAAALADGATIGDATNDTANSIVLADNNTLIYIGKSSGLYSVDGAGNVGSIYRRKFPVKGSSDSGGAVPWNFRQPTEIDGRLYWLVGDYTIIERETVDGTFTEFNLKDFGNDNPRAQLPILAMCAGPDGTLYLAVGTNTASTIDLTYYAAGTQLLANTITTGTTYLVKGFGLAKSLLTDPYAWTWHMSLGSFSELAQLMWYSEGVQRLFLGFGTPTTANTASYFRYTQDTGGTYTTEDDVFSGGSAVLPAFDTAANGDWLLIGFSRPFSGLYFSANAFNNNVATMTVEYLTAAASYTALTKTDGTSTGSATLGRTGLVQWTLPAAGLWPLVTPTNVAQEAYWVRISFSALLDGGMTASSWLLGDSDKCRQFVVVSGNPAIKTDTGPYDTSGTVKVSDQTAILETGKFHDQRPLDVKALTKFEAIVQNIGQASSTLAMKYRTTSDRNRSSGYTTLATYTTDALAQTGTRFAYDATNPVNFTEGMRAQLVIAPNTDGVPVRLEAAVVRFVQAETGRRRLVCRLKEVVNGAMNRHGSRQSTSIKEVITNLQAWRSAVNPIASVVDNDLGITMNMRLEDFDPRVSGKDDHRVITVSLIEVA